MPRLSKIGAAALAAFGWTGGASVSASYLVVAGGGSGGSGAGTVGNSSGGGGAGGLLTGTVSLNPTLSYTVTVGGGGTGSGTSFGTNGSNSVFHPLLQRAAVLLLLLVALAVARVEAQVLGVLALLDKAIRVALAQMELRHTHQAVEVALVQ